MGNPFSLSFGKTPQTIISRASEIQDIIDDFTSNAPASQSYVITGVRGSGKTVAMTNVAKQLSEQDEWIVINLNPNRPLLESLVAKLYDEPALKLLFINAKIDLSFLGIGVSVDSKAPVNDIELVLEHMLKHIKKEGKRVLVTIDEVSKNPEIRMFASSFQILIREDLPIFLIMTGLYENIYELQNDKTLTFLFRVPRLDLAPLSLISIKNRYRQIFNVSENNAARMAQLTQGYPFAFQVLGYLCWKNHDYIEDSAALLPVFDEYLQEYVYQKIWIEVSEKDREVLRELAKYGRMSIKELRENLGFSSPTMAVYRDRLKRKGIIDASEYGYVRIILPRLREYIRSYEELM